MDRIYHIRCLKAENLNFLSQSTEHIIIHTTIVNTPTISKPPGTLFQIKRSANFFRTHELQMFYFPCRLSTRHLDGPKYNPYSDTLFTTLVFNTYCYSSLWKLMSALRTCNLDNLSGLNVQIETHPASMMQWNFPSNDKQITSWRFT